MTFPAGRQRPRPLPLQYAAEIVRSDGDRATIYINNDWKRVEHHHHHGATSVVIFRPDLRQMYSRDVNGKWSMYPLDKQMLAVMEARVSEDGEWEYLGEEEGFDKFHVFAPRGERPCEMLYVDKVSGLRMKSITLDKLGRPALVTELHNVHVGPPPSHHFDPPAELVDES